MRITDEINCGILNLSRHIISYNKDFTKINRSEGLSEGCFNWIEGGIYKGKVYCFPRKSNALACYDYMHQENNAFMEGYLSYNLYMRPSCGQCDFKGVPRQAGLTLADFWGIDAKLNDNKGIAMIFRY